MAAVVATLTVGSPARSQAADPAGAEVLRRDHEMAEAVVAADLERLEGLYAADYVYVGSDGKPSTRSERLQAFRSKALRFLSTEHLGATVRVYGDTAIVEGQARSRVVAGERAIEGDFRYVGVWVRQSGVWRIAYTQATRIASGPVR